MVLACWRGLSVCDCLQEEKLLATTKAAEILLKSWHAAFHLSGCLFLQLSAGKILLKNIKSRCNWSSAQTVCPVCQLNMSVAMQVGCCSAAESFSWQNLSALEPKCQFRWSCIAADSFSWGLLLEQLCLRAAVRHVITIHIYTTSVFMIKLYCHRTSLLILLWKCTRLMHLTLKCTNIFWHEKFLSMWHNVTPHWRG